MSFSTKSELISILGNEILINKLSVKFRNEISISGYEWNVIKSGLQKYIRRNNVNMALKMCMEMYCFDYISGGNRILTNGLHRLQVIFLEDIGCGNLKLWTKLCEWFDEIYKERVKDDRNREKEIIILKKIVINLCKSRKIRGCSFMNSICHLSKENMEKIKNCKYVKNIELSDNFDDICIDLVKYLERKHWKAIVIFRRILTMLNNMKGIEKRKNKLKMENISVNYFKFIECSKKWEKDIEKLKEGYLLYFVQLCEYLYGSDELQLIDNIEINGKWNIDMIGKVKLDDFVYDMHVRNSKNKSTSYFANISSYVEPKATNIRLPFEFEEIYKWLKMNDGNELVFIKNKIENMNKIENIKNIKKRNLWIFPKKENDLVFVCRAQLVTSHNKTDTYYAKGINKNIDQLWLIKGPFVQKEEIEEFIFFQKLKKKYKLPYIKCFIKQMVVDRWPERPGIGIRHKFNIYDKGYFMFSKSVIKEEDLEFEIRNSKMWNSTQVVNLKKFSVDLFTLTDKQMISYMENIGFRIKYNIGDLACRNFIIVGENIYSVDENKTQQKINLQVQLKNKKYNLLKKKYELLKSKMNKEMCNIIDNYFQINKI